ncbi:glycoside hydrolase family 1 protein [Arcanobacterium bovis]|nr:family 1 glycosylhydrolase [Arcanobacterium bovis]
METMALTFKIGTASAAVQIEGDLPRTNWHAWAEKPGSIKDGTSPEPATGHWKRWREDNALMQELHLQIARISLDWTRIEPRRGQWDETAVARYREELIDLKERGIEPLVTLHHFSHPQWFEEMGGFAKEQNISLFIRFVAKILAEFGDLVSDWNTINEPNVFATQSFLYNETPPGGKSWRKALTTMRNFAIAHIRAYKLIHSTLDAPGRTINVSIAHHIRGFTPLNPKNPVHRAFAKIDDYLYNRLIENACYNGNFHPLLGRPPCDIQRGHYCDVVAINYYTRSTVRGLTDGVFPGAPVNDLGWEIYPQGIVECARELHERHRLPIWITENGTADNGSDTELERFRPKYLLDHFAAMAASGLPFERYYHWCFVDNWEWSEGMVPHFGIVHLDPTTLERTPKPSAYMLRDIIDQGKINDDIYQRYVK